MTICFYDKPTETYIPIVVAALGNNPYYADSQNVIPAPYYGCENIDDTSEDRNHDEAQGEDTFLCHATGQPGRPSVPDPGR